jgi:hypothetical protein
MIYVALAVMFGLLVLHTGLAYYVALQAKQRGYSFWAWFLAGSLANVLFFVIMLALMPDRSLPRRRSELRRELIAKLQGRRWLGATGNSPQAFAKTSLGDMATYDPEKAAGPNHDGSIDNQATYFPNANQSVGDQATFMRPSNDALDDQATRMPD